MNPLAEFLSQLRDLVLQPQSRQLWELDVDSIHLTVRHTNGDEKEIIIRQLEPGSEHWHIEIADGEHMTFTSDNTAKTLADWLNDWAVDSEMNAAGLREYRSFGEAIPLKFTADNGDRGVPLVLQLVQATSCLEEVASVKVISDDCVCVSRNDGRELFVRLLSDGYKIGDIETVLLAPSGRVAEHRLGEGCYAAIPDVAEVVKMWSEESSAPTSSAVPSFKKWPLFRRFAE